MAKWRDDLEIIINLPKLEPMNIPAEADRPVRAFSASIGALAAAVAAAHPYFSNFVTDAWQKKIAAEERNARDHLDP